ncbi:MAG: VanZ family protein [Gemmatimonadota bacterium]
MENLVRRASAGAWIVALLALTMVPSPGLGPYDRLVLCVLCGSEGSADAILNVVLFVPLGLLVAGTKRAPWRAAALGLLISLAVESTQLFVPGRQPALGDLIWNTLGAALGVLLHGAVVGRLRRTSGSAVPALGASLVTGVSVIAAGWLLGARPSTELYWSLWTPRLGGMPQYGGALANAMLDGNPLPPGAFPSDRNPVRAWLGDWTFEATLQKGAPPPRLAPVISLIDTDRDETAFLGLVGEDLVWRERLRAGTFSFHQPAFRVPGALSAVQVGDTTRVQIRRVGVDRCITVDGHTSCRRGFTPGRTWSLLIGAGTTNDLKRRGLDLIWLLALGVPTGFLSIGWSAARHGLLLTALVAASARITHLGTWHLVSESLAVMAGVGLGACAVLLIQRVHGVPH